MRTIISQSIVLPAPAESLFVMYTDPAKHAAITGAPVAISLKPGSPFQAFNGALTGATLQIIPQRLVIQSWRSTKFNDEDPDSTLILAFTPKGTNGRIDLVHLDVPAHNYQSVVEGWETHYWGPCRQSRLFQKEPVMPAALYRGAVAPMHGGWPDNRLRPDARRERSRGNRRRIRAPMSGYPRPFQSISERLHAQCFVTKAGSRFSRNRRSKSRWWA